MSIHSFPTGPFSTNGYILSCPVTGEAALVDPAHGSAAPFFRYLSEHQLICRAILLTHSHWDHIADVAVCKEHFPHATIYLHHLDAPNLESPGADGLPCWIHILPAKADVDIFDGDKIQIGEIFLSVLHTPGHTPGGVCFYAEKEGILLSGDTLFKGAIGNLSFPTSQPEKMPSSLAKLAALPPQTRVYPGHGQPTTIGEEFK